MRFQLKSSSVWTWLAMAWGLLMAGCAHVEFEQGRSQLDDKALVFGRILLDRDGEKLVVSPFSMPVVIRNIESADEPKILAQNFEKDGAFHWALPPGRYQLSLVLHNYSGGVVSYSFHLEKAGRAYYFGDLTLHGSKRFDSFGSANMRDIRPEFVDAFAEAKTRLASQNPQIDPDAVDRLLVRNMLDPIQRGAVYSEALERMSLCCPNYAQLIYKKLSVGQRVSEQIGPASPVFAFPEGKSRFIAWQLPAALNGKTLALRSVVTPSSMPGTGYFYIFSPAVMFLDENFNLMDEPRFGLFTPVPASVMPPRSASLQANIPLTDRLARARYVILYTSRSIIEGTWRTTRPGFVPIAGGLLPTGLPVSVLMEPAISGVLEAEIVEP